MIFIVGCAQINPLIGGAKDVTAPKIDPSGTYPANGQTNFTEDEVTLKFNEFVKLNNPTDNIIITPQLQKQADFSVKNKKVTIQFNEELLENTTYTISFNRAISDITESNDSIFQFVFSTGDYIDSLSYSGQVLDAYTNQPNAELLIGLFSSESEYTFDSIPYKERPIYIAQTDQQGKFKMNYLKGGEYYLYAIADENKNLKLDAQEKRAFVKTKKITVETVNKEITMHAFQPENVSANLSTTNFDFPGKLTFVLTGNPQSFDVSSAVQMIPEKMESQDSLIFWLKENPLPKMKFFLKVNEELDTIRPLYRGAPEDNSARFLTMTTNVDQGQLLPQENLRLTFDEPIKEFNLSGFHFLAKDSSEVEIDQGIIENLRNIDFNTFETTIKMLKIDSGATTSYYGTTNNEIPVFGFENYEQDYFGSLTLNIDTLFEGAVNVELINEENETIRTENFQEKIIFLDLPPAKYQVRLIFDANNDGKWTTGSLTEERLPEKVLYNKELINIRSGWEQEIDWFIQNNRQ